MPTARRSIADSPHSGLLLADALRFSKIGKNLLVGLVQSECHRHVQMVPN